jgi:hypothetical protein
MPSASRLRAPALAACLAACSGAPSQHLHAEDLGAASDERVEDSAPDDAAPEHDAALEPLVEPTSSAAATEVLDGGPSLDAAPPTDAAPPEPDAAPACTEESQLCGSACCEPGSVCLDPAAGSCAALTGEWRGFWSWTACPPAFGCSVGTEYTNLAWTLRVTGTAIEGTWTPSLASLSGSSAGPELTLRADYIGRSDVYDTCTGVLSDARIEGTCVSHYTSGPGSYRFTATTQ